MIWLLYILVIVACISIGVVASKRNRAETLPTSYDAPIKIDRNDFENLGQDIVVIAFTSKSCDTCAGILTKVKVLESSEVGVQNVEYEDPQGKKLHKKYEIEAVPTVIICDASGVTQKAFLGSVTSTDLWAGVAKLRGAEIEDCQSH